MASLKRKAGPPSPAAAAASSSSHMMLDKKLLPRIHTYLDSLDPSLTNITPASIVEYLRRTYPEYARKPQKGFSKNVAQLCERMRQEAVAQESGVTVTTEDSVDDDDNDEDDANMSDVRVADDVVILSSSVTPTNQTVQLSFAPNLDKAASNASIISSPSPSTSSAPDSKRRKLDNGTVAPAALDEGADADEADEGSSANSSSSEEEQRDVIDVEFVEAEDKNMVNSTMRNLYNRLNTSSDAANASTAASSPTDATRTPYVPNPQKPRERKPKEKVVYNTNSKKVVSAKKKANQAKGNVHFQTSNAGPDDPAAHSIGGGDGTNWHPEVLYPTSTYADLGGIEGILQEIHELIEYPLSHPEIYHHLGVQPPRGVLLHGPPGTGKTCLAHAIAGELGVPFMKISAPEVVSGMSGESEQKLRTLFADALENAPCILFIDEIDAITPKRATAQREMERRIVAQLLTCMDSLSTTASGDPNKIVIVIGATNRPDSLDSALRRAGRFDREIAIGIPDESARARILQVMCRAMKVEPAIDWAAIAKKAVGYVGADLMALTREAAVIAINRIFRTVLPTPSLKPTADPTNKDSMALPPFNLLMASASPKLGALIPPSATAVKSAAALELTASLSAANLPPSVGGGASMSAPSLALTPSGSTGMVAHLIPDAKSLANQAELHSRARTTQKLRDHVQPLTESQLAPLFISFSDFDSALKKVQPSSKREGFATIPDVSWNDIGALDELREELSMTILQPILNPQQFESIGLTVPAGVLLFGPPGCGKTLVAKAIANESGASFLSIKGPELLNQYVGQSERAVRKVFQRARASAPCVIFFDELDALVPKRGSGGNAEGNNVSERVVNQLLTEMDGLEERRFVFVIAATNRPDIIDPAMLRPGRLDKLLYVKLPSAAERAAILRKHLRRTPLSSEVDIAAIAADPRAEGFSGADVAALVREATLQALREAQQKQREEMVAKGGKADMLTWGSIKAAAAAAASSNSPAISSSPATATSANTPLPVLVCTNHFHFAFSKVFPSVSHASRAKYDRMHRMLSRARSTLSNDAPGATVGKQPDGSSIDQAALEEDREEEARAAAAAANVSSSPIPHSAPIVKKSPSQLAMPPPPPKQPSNSNPNANSLPMPAIGTTILSSMTAAASSSSSFPMQDATR